MSEKATEKDTKKASVTIVKPGPAEETHYENEHLSPEEYRKEVKEAIKLIDQMNRQIYNPFRN